MIEYPGTFRISFFSYFIFYSDVVTYQPTISRNSSALLRILHK